MKSYTPGYSGTKLFFAVFGLAVAAVGFCSIYPPLRLFFEGTRANARITTEVVSHPGKPDRIFTAKRDVKYDVANTFHFLARYRAPDGSFHTGRLQLAYHGTSDAQIGQTFLVAYYPPTAASASRPVTLVPIFSLGTWTFGGVLIIVGLYIAAVQSLYLFYSRTPIKIPDEQPIDLPQ